MVVQMRVPEIILVSNPHFKWGYNTGSARGRSRSTTFTDCPLDRAYYFLPSSNLCADKLTLDPVFNTILEKKILASQTTLSRFFNRMDADTLLQFDDIDIFFHIKEFHLSCRYGNSTKRIP